MTITLATIVGGPESGSLGRYRCHHDSAKKDVPYDPCIGWQGGRWWKTCWFCHGQGQVEIGDVEPDERRALGASSDRECD
jgi:hypothetical protein